MQDSQRYLFYAAALNYDRRSNEVLLGSPAARVNYNNIICALFSSVAHSENNNNANNNNEVVTPQSRSPCHGRRSASPSVPIGFWQDIKNQRDLFDRIGQQLGIEHLDDWYRVPLSVVRSAKIHGATSLLQNYYGNSLSRALQTVYPEHNWDDLKFSKVPRGFWNNVENHRRFFDAIAPELGVKHLDDWYNIKQSQVCAKGGAGLLTSHYGTSLHRALKAVYPEHDWDPSKFHKATRNHWNNVDNQRHFFDELGKELGINHLDDWYNIRVKDIAHRASGILDHYGHSLLRALQAIYPEHEWHSWRFARMPSPRLMSHQEQDRSSSNTNSNSNDQLHSYISALSRDLSIQNLDDWYRVSRRQLSQHRGYTLIARHGGLVAVLKKLYPEHSWDEKKFVGGGAASSKKKSSQRWMRVTLARMFPGVELLEDYLSPQLRFPDSTDSIEFDVFIPSLRLAFEYQGQQHFQDVQVFGGSSSKDYNKHQDEAKIAACREAGITLIPVPYWWDGTVESLAATICAVRPDLMMHLLKVVGDTEKDPTTEPIATSPPPSPPAQQQRRASASATSSSSSNVSSA